LEFVLQSNFSTKKLFFLKKCEKKDILDEMFLPSAGLVYLEWVRDRISICRHVGIVVKVCVRWRERVGEGVKRGSKQYSEKYVERVCVCAGRKEE
jgi:hypothetical protein